MHLSCLYRQATQTVGPIPIGADTLADAIALGPKRGCGSMRTYTKDSTGVTCRMPVYAFFSIVSSGSTNRGPFLILSSYSATSRACSTSSALTLKPPPKLTTATNNPKTTENLHTPPSAFRPSNSGFVGGVLRPVDVLPNGPGPA